MDGLSADDQLTFEIGRLARQDAQLDHELRRLWVAMLDSPHAENAVPRGFRDLVEGCERLAPLVAPDHSETLMAAIRSARAAHDRRNTLVHERWARDEDGAGWIRQGNGFRPVKESSGWQLDQFRDVGDWVEVATMQCVAATVLVGLLKLDTPVDPLDLARWSAICRGEITPRHGGFTFNDESLGWVFG